MCRCIGCGYMSTIQRGAPFECAENPEVQLRGDLKDDTVVAVVRV
jgi:hypothetical protein